ncbi:hypothetical protein C5167_033406 [Papaver somniferum]|uniref:DOG1 domain-containing protein n=1 Tax=Papaver somniferum TaxID=3469 RepID=A0A4Y7KA74_PAPSO|nr:hypothetical protein C5167_033406 [Papaver somniferum]
MQSFTVIGDESSRLNQPRFSDLGELEQSNGFHHNDYINMPHSNPSFSLKSTSSVVAASLQIPGFNSNINTSEIYSPRNNGVDSRPYFQKGNSNNVQALAPLGNGHFENWGESTGIMPDTSQHTDTSTDTDDHKNQFPGVCEGGTSVDSMDRLNGKLGDQKSLRRLAQNREAARKSRLRKKVKGIFIASGSLAEQGHLTGGKGNLAFDMEYARWLDEHQRQINDLRTAVKSNVGDNELRLLVDGVMSHYDEIFQLKTTATKSDVFHMLSGMWKTPAERFFMWLGGFRSSELLKILGNHLEPLTDQQLMGICNLQQSSQQAEDALSQGMEALQQSLSETLSAGSLGPGSGNVADYMGQMAIAMGKLGTLENFLNQADLLRQQTLQQMHRILTTRQAARAFLVINDYFSRLRALSSLWLARPRD